MRRTIYAFFSAKDFFRCAVNRFCGCARRERRRAFAKHASGSRPRPRRIDPRQPRGRQVAWEKQKTRREVRRVREKGRESDRDGEEREALTSATCAFCDG